jgi:hypothetical protein
MLARWNGVRLAGRQSVWAAWGLNILLLGSAFGWVFFFGESRTTIGLMRQVVFGGSSSGIVIRDPSRLGSGVTIGLIAAVAALVTGASMFVSLLAGERRFRTLRMWLVFMAAACGWLGVVVAWPAVYWMGQQQRVGRIVPPAEQVAEALRTHWPAADSDSKELGPFLAYPINAPTVLMPLTQPVFPNSSQRFSAVERTGNEVLRFELSPPESDAWLEWRGDGERPRSFVGGLATRYEIEKSAEVAPGWFLVRYRAAGLAGGT